MHRKLTINLNEDVYRGLHRVVGRGSIGRFLENLARPHVIKGGDLEPRAGLGCTGYKGAAPTDAEIGAGMRKHAQRRWEKKAGTAR